MPGAPVLTIAVFHSFVVIARLLSESVRSSGESKRLDIAPSERRTAPRRGTVHTARLCWVL